MDLVFLENVNKILTNCQVQIKTEVSTIGWMDGSWDGGINRQADML